MTKKEEGPDQARSWAIAMAGCVINSLLSGITRTSGLFYVALIENYGATRMEANMPFTIRNVIRNLGGIAVGVIGQRYGGQGVTFIGGIFASLGIALCYFAPNPTWVSVCWGGLHGLGAALGNTLFPVIVNQYFLKYRATASGISLSGACIAAFIFPSILEYLLEDVGLAGTFLITGAFMMNICPAAILMIQPSWMKRKRIIKSVSVRKDDFSKIRSVSQYVQRLEKIGEDSVEVAAVNRKQISSLDGVQKAEEDNFQPVSRDARVFSRNGVDNPAFVRSKIDISEKNAEKMDVEFHPEIRVRTVSMGDNSFTLPVSFNEDQETSIKKGIVKVIQDPMFHVISIAMVGFGMLFDPAVTVIVDYVMDKGFKEDNAKYFIIMLALGDLIGRLCFGWVTDRNFITLPKFMLLLQVVQGACFLLLPLFYRFEVLIFLITIYGLASGATLVMFPILVAKYLSSVQSLAIGFMNTFMGILSFAVPPLIGYFRDNAGSYDGMFMITGSLSVVAGFLWLLEPFLVRFQASQRYASTSTNINV